MRDLFQDMILSQAGSVSKKAVKPSIEAIEPVMSCLYGGSSERGICIPVTRNHVSLFLPDAHAGNFGGYLPVNIYNSGPLIPPVEDLDRVNLSVSIHTIEHQLSRYTSPSPVSGNCMQNFFSMCNLRILWQNLIVDCPMEKVYIGEEAENRSDVSAVRLVCYNS